jgi:hypothetical protein
MAKMNERFLIVNFKFSKRRDEDRLAELKKVFNKGLDWLRFSSTCWIVYTRQTPDTWYVRLRSILATDDEVFIAEFDPSTAQGRIKAWLWEWLNFDRTQDKTVGDAISRQIELRSNVQADE